MNANQHRRFREHTTQVCASTMLIHRYFLTLNLKRIPNGSLDYWTTGNNYKPHDRMTWYINKFFQHLSGRSRSHIIAVVGYNVDIRSEGGNRKPHFHSVVVSEKPINSKHIKEAYKSHPDKALVKDYYVNDYEPSIEVYSEPVDCYNYTELKHTYYATAIYHPRSRCANARCRVLKRYESDTQFTCR